MIKNIHELRQLACKCFQKRNSNTNTYLDLIESSLKVELNKVNYHMDFGNHFIFHFIYMFRTNGNQFFEAFHRMTTSIQKLFICKSLFEEAIEILKAVQRFNTETHGKNNIFTLDTKHNIANCLNNMGKYNKAVEVYYSFHKIKNEMLGITHPSTITTKHNIALCLNNMGKFNEALEIYYSVNKIENEIFSINHPSTMATKHNIAFCLNNIGKYNEALEIYYSVAKLQTESFGINHPITMTTKNNIASSLFFMGNYNEAFEIYNFVDKNQTEILGINHSDTMTTVASGSSAYQASCPLSQIAIFIFDNIDSFSLKVLNRLGLQRVCGSLQKLNKNCTLVT
nr:kinesin light chain 3-like [Hydra vulgaris]